MFKWLRRKPKIRPVKMDVGQRREGGSDFVLDPYWPMDQPLVRLTERDCLTARDLFEGMLVLGNPGSGKTSTTGSIVPMAALQAGWGVVAFTTKPDDAEFWQRLCAATGRSSQLRIVRPDGNTFFNLIRYELERPSPGGGNTLKLAALLTEAFREGKPQNVASEASEFFIEQMQILLCNAMDALRLAKEPLSFRAIQRLIAATPSDPEDLESDHWKSGYCFEVLKRANENATSPKDASTNEIVARYFLENFPHMNPRTRGDVLATVESALFQLNREPVRQLLDSPNAMSFVPEQVESGMVLVIDCPVSIHGPVGRMLTICFKRLVKEMLRRRVLKGDQTRPVLFFADECQTYCTKDDAEFSQIARSNRVSIVYLTQSIDNLEAVLGNAAHTNSLANALTTHIYHCTSGKTADWIERRIANNWMSMETLNYPGHSATEPKRGVGVNVSQSLQPQVLAGELTRLRTGGPRNRNLVEAIVFKPGRFFHGTRTPFVRVRFQQG